MADPRTPPATRLVTLTTDFGDTDTYVAQMKGVILSIHPAAEVIDLTHGVPAHDVAAGSFLLATAVDAFPDGTIHVVVVDPGVGTDRRAVAVQTDRHVYLAPDNGVLTGVLDSESTVEAYEIVERHYLRERVSSTFHGRDVFASAAGWIARGTRLANLGPPAGELRRLERQRAEPVAEAAVAVRVLHVDRFGNAILDVRASELRRFADAGLVPTVTAGSTLVDRLCRTFAEIPAGEAALLVGSAGYLEIVVDRGRAADRLGLVPGATVELRLTSGTSVL